MENICPWYDYTPAVLTFCEAHRCSWVQEPLNTFSNIGFILVSFYILRKYKKSSELTLIGLAALFVGITSGLYHASSSFFFEVFDFSSMFLLVNGMILFNLNRAGKMTNHLLFPKAIVLSIIGITLMVFYTQLGEIIFNSFLLGTFITEFYTYRMAKRKAPQQPLTYSYKYYWYAVGSYALAYVFWGMDYFKFYCHPESSYFQGHAVWHLLGAVTFFMLSVFYAQFYFKNNQV